jgi:uncharacterized coiled-coil protein SlyX
MNAKLKILDLLDLEISGMISSYEQKIKELEKRVAIQEKTINKHKTGNTKLRVQLSNIISNQQKTDYDLLSHCLERLSNGINQEMIEECCMSTSVDDAILSLAVCENLWTNLNTEKLNYVFRILSTNPNVLLQDNEEVAKRLLNLIKLFLIENITDKSECDQLLSNMMDILIGVHNASFYPQIADLIQKNIDTIFDNVLMLNEPPIINKFLRMLRVYSVNSIRDSLIQILDIEWQFIENSLGKSDFIFLLWYSYLYDLDKKLLERASITHRFKENSVDFELYFYDDYGKSEDIKSYQNILKQFMEETVLTQIEIELVIKKLGSRTEETDNSPKLRRFDSNQATGEIPINIANEVSFSWPKTEVEVSSSDSNLNEKTLNEKSELMLTGYRITGLTRSKRWLVLQKAVPQLGLKKVVYTIAYNVKLRKGQKNGTKKFQYAISEWKHDLNKLRKHYYKEDFNWPAI